MVSADRHDPVPRARRRQPRALMGANMQRQAVPLVRSEAPLVGTGWSYRAAVDAGDVVVAEAGVVKRSRPTITDDGRRRHRQDVPAQQVHPLQPGHHQPASVVDAEGDRVEAGQVIADGPVHRRTARWRWANLLVAFMPWEGHNTRTRSSCQPAPRAGRRPHLDPHRGARDRRPRHQARPEEITRDIPNVSDEVLADLDERGIIRIGAEVRDGDILVGKVTPKGETELTPEERLLRAIFGEKAARSATPPEGAARRDRHGHRRRVFRGTTTSCPRRQPVGPRLRGPEAQDLRRRQARRPARQQGRHRKILPSRTCRS